MGSIKKRRSVSSQNTRQNQYFSHSGLTSSSILETQFSNSWLLLVAAASHFQPSVHSMFARELSTVTLWSDFVSATVIAFIDCILAAAACSKTSVPGSTVVTVYLVPSAMSSSGAASVTPGTRTWQQGPWTDYANRMSFIKIWKWQKTTPAGMKIDDPVMGENNYTHTKWSQEDDCWQKEEWVSDGPQLLMSAHQTAKVLAQMEHESTTRSTTSLDRSRSPPLDRGSLSSSLAAATLRFLNENAEGVAQENSSWCSIPSCHQPLMGGLDIGQELSSWQVPRRAKDQLLPLLLSVVFCYRCLSNFTATSFIDFMFEPPAAWVWCESYIFCLRQWRLVELRLGASPQLQTSSKHVTAIWQQGQGPWLAWVSGRVPTVGL